MISQIVEAWTKPVGRHKAKHEPEALEASGVLEKDMLSELLPSIPKSFQIRLE